MVQEGPQNRQRLPQSPENHKEGRSKEGRREAEMELPKRQGRERHGRGRNYQSLQNNDGRGKDGPNEEGSLLPMQKGGHLSCDCPEKKGKTTVPQPTTSAPTPTAPKKMTAKELTAHIRSLTALLNEEEKTEFYDEAEKEGF